MKTCDICLKSSDNEKDVVLYGEWMCKQNINVHYFCLLLSSNLPQTGTDTSGILGFLIRDIRQGAAAAKQHKCTYCGGAGASIACCKCHIYFHLECSIDNNCISHFCGEFRSFCMHCAPLNDYQKQLLNKAPNRMQCDICFRIIQRFTLSQVVYGDCCRKGFAHRICMQQYALTSGYYLRCIWCRNTKFRDLIRLQSIFVPDRDATWEREPNAFRELYVKQLRCDLTECLCPRGRNYAKNSWNILRCILCGAAGAHTKCIVGSARAAKTAAIPFKCDACIDVEMKLQENKKKSHVLCGNIDASFHVNKSSATLNTSSPMYSDQETESSSSQITVINTQERRLLEAQSPHIESRVGRHLSLKEAFDCEDHFYLVIYRYNERRDDCIGTCTLRFPLNDERIINRSQSALELVNIREEDIWFCDSDRGIYDEIDKYIANL